jgi:hypothetical protein
MDSLPHVRKLSEISCPVKRDGRRREVNDEREKVAGQGGSQAVPERPKEGKRANTGRVGGSERLQSMVCGGAIARAWQCHQGRTLALTEIDPPVLTEIDPLS